MSQDKVPLPLDKHGWSPSPLPGLVVLVTTTDNAGNPNVATKSWISMAALGPPPVIMFGCTLKHKTARNALATNELVVNFPGTTLAKICWEIGTNDQIPREKRFDYFGLTLLPATKVRPPLVAECRAHLECELAGHRQWDDDVAIFGRVVAASIDGDLVEGDKADRYRGLAPFFFLEDALTAGLGPASEVGAPTTAAHHTLTILAVEDLERSTTFYRGAFGWPTCVEVPVYVEFELPDGRGLGLYRREGFGRNTGQTPMVVPAGELVGNELYFHVTDLEAAVQRLARAGARELSPIAARDWGDEAAYFADPDGNVIVVARPLVRGAPG